MLEADRLIISENDIEPFVIELPLVYVKNGDIYGLDELNVEPGCVLPLRPALQ
jgi:hypothetical protein